MIKMVRPSRWSSRSRSITDAPDFESRLPVGSSASTIDGRLTIARRDRDALALATGQLVRCVLHAIAEAHTVERFCCALSALARRDAPIQQAVGHVVEGRHSLEQEELLEDETDELRSHRRQLLVRHRRRLDSGQTKHTARRPIEGADDVQQRRLTRAGRPDDRGEFTGIDPQRHAVERANRWLSGVLLDHVDQLERGYRFTIVEISAIDAIDGGHDGTTTLWPACTPAPVIATKPSVNSPGVTPISWVVCVPSAAAPVTTSIA